MTAEKRRPQVPAGRKAPRFGTVLIANRGEIAVRIARTLRSMGIRSVAVYSRTDRNSPHVSAADQAVDLGGRTAAESYLKAGRILAAARKCGARAVIPGYGFLSENADFAGRCEAAGLAFIGPTPLQIRLFGLKHTSRRAARRAGVPLVPGTGLLKDLGEARRAAERIGYPVMLKSTAGGGGIGLARCAGAAALAGAFGSVRRMGREFFGNGGLFLERFVEGARHVEVQIFGDGKGRVAALGERDCSLQRRHQKVVEETPAPRLPAATRRRLLESAVRLGESVRYRSAGTVEYIYDPSRDEFYFLEVNTRLQVEHAVTEAVTGIDLVEWMVRLAAGETLPLGNPPAPRGAALEARLYAENPARGFQPSSGVITEASFPKGARVDTWVEAGTEVTPYYDSLLAKLVVSGRNRAEALAKLRSALARTRLSGINTNLDYLRRVAGSAFFRKGETSTDRLAGFGYAPEALEVLEPGTFTTLQDYPGRVGYWDVGVPPSGPMDDLAFRLANRIVGNPPSAAGLECTLAGPRLLFHCDAVVALAGAPSEARLDGAKAPFWAPLSVKAGQVLDVGRAQAGCRTYLAVRKGLDVPPYLGSRSTFVRGRFGGHAGRTLRVSDLLAVRRREPGLRPPRPAPRALIPSYPRQWEIGVLDGPLGAPDFLTEEAVRMLLSTAWEVHYNSNRMGVRLKGPRPAWPRSDGGEAGLHPSNIHDTQYAVGAVNFMGDMPVILTRDGPSLGGFVCPLTVVKAELWKVGQAKPGDRIRFRRLDLAEALALERDLEEAVEKLAPPRGGRFGPSAVPRPGRKPSAGRGTDLPRGMLALLPPRGPHPQVAYRQAGDQNLLIEYGPNTLDLRLRFRVHALMEELRRNPVAGVRELSPGVRCLQVRYDAGVLPQGRLLEALLAAEDRLPAAGALRVPTRVVHLPMAFEDPATLEAVARYRRSVRDTAPWLPSNTEFIRRINGLKDRGEVRRILFEASYLVLGLGDVYLGAPCAVPVDPRHRLLTSKYNPARTHTPEGAVGIGGVYMCIYGMESPGGYQLVGRTLPIWDRYRKNPAFAGGKPWLLRFFDQVRFYPVDEGELAAQREAFREGRLSLRVEKETFDLAVYERFLEDNAEDIEAFRGRQKAAFDEEAARWKEEGFPAAAGEAPEARPEAPPEEGGVLVRAPISGCVWKLQVRAGDRVREGQALAVLEAMKMEFTVAAESAGTVGAVYCRPGTQVGAGDPLLVLRPARSPEPAGRKGR